MGNHPFFFYRVSSIFLVCFLPDKNFAQTRVTEQHFAARCPPRCDGTGLRLCPGTSPIPVQNQNSSLRLVSQMLHGHVPPWLFQTAKHYMFGNVVTSPACHLEHFSSSSLLAGSCQGDLQTQILQGTPGPL